MSVTVADILKLPTMRGSQLVAGQDGLNKAVTGVTVLELSTPGDTMNELFQANRQYMGNELCITGFINCADDPSAQCDIVHHMANVGMVCIVLYYMGIFVNEIDPMVINTANQLQIPIICMPKNRKDMRYADLISEAMELIIIDRQDDRNVATEIISQILCLSESQRTVSTALRMLSSRLHTSIVLTNENGYTLGESLWPNFSESIADKITMNTMPSEAGMIFPFSPLPNHQICMELIPLRSSGNIRLFMIGENNAVRISAAHAAAEAMRLVIEIWSEHHSDLVYSEIVRAILQDEPIKMRQLAHLLNVNIADMHSAWLLHPRSPSEVFPTEAENQLADIAQLIGIECISGLYKPTELVLVFRSSQRLAEIEALAEEAVRTLNESIPDGVTLTAYPYLETTSDVRSNYLRWCDALPTVLMIQPRQSIFYSHDIDFVEHVKDVIAAGEESVNTALQALRPIEDPVLLQTLQIYLLDAQSSMTLCAERMNVHKNTIKYRIHKINDLLGFELGIMPTTAHIYLALAVLRVLNKL